MTRDYPRMTNGMLVSLVIASFLLGVVGGIVLSVSTPITKNASTSTISIRTTSTIAERSPKLSVLISPLVLSAGQNVSIFAVDNNTLPDSLTLWLNPLPNPSQFPCGGRALITTVYMGRYTSSNLSAAQPLVQYNATSRPICPPMVPSVYTFQPYSDRITWYVGS